MTTPELTTTPDAELPAAIRRSIARAWEDGDLTDLEIAAVCMAVMIEPGIELSCKEALRQWLDLDDATAGRPTSTRPGPASAHRHPTNGHPTNRRHTWTSA